MKIGLLSDLHGSLPITQKWPKLDLLLLAGDICPNFGWDFAADKHLQFEWMEETFDKWCQHNKAKRTVFILGNHDTVGFLPKFKDKYCVDSNGKSPLCINNSYYKVNDINIYGLPQTKILPGWSLESWFGAFYEDDQFFYAFPDPSINIDILLSHGPCYSILDKTHDGIHTGSPALSNFVFNELKPKYFINGHIHEDFGIKRVNDVVFINPFNQLHILDI